MVTNPNVPSDTFVITKKQRKQGNDEESNNRSRSDFIRGDKQISRTRKKVLRRSFNRSENKCPLLVDDHH
ncbi:hypothetical protein CE91St24_23650 [Odoribacteraceae bacterium]|nr:hypothetical protein CE91St24_23650 [Odoribacteraceae bacterium]